MLCARQHEVKLWARDPEVADGINRTRHNPKYLSDVALSERVRASADLEEVLAGGELVILAVPSHGIRKVMGEAGKYLEPGAILVSTIKGIEGDIRIREGETFLLRHDGQDPQPVQPFRSLRSQPFWRCSFRQILRVLQR